MLKYKPYLIGFLVAVIVIWLIVYVYFYWGFMGWAADGPMGSLEAFFLAGSLDRWIYRNAPIMSNPQPANDSTIMAGIKIYRNHCAVCHGNPQNTVSELGRGFYPPARQFMRDSSRMSENGIYWVVKHGIARSGMPSWKGVLSDADIWRVTMAVSRFSNVERLWGPAQQEVIVTPAEAPATIVTRPVPTARVVTTRPEVVTTVPNRAPMATVTTRATDSTARPSAVVPRSTVVVRPRRRATPEDCATYPNCPIPKGSPQSPYVY